MFRTAGAPCSTNVEESPGTGLGIRFDAVRDDSSSNPVGIGDRSASIGGKCSAPATATQVAGTKAVPSAAEHPGSEAGDAHGEHSVPGPSLFDFL